MLQYFHKTHTDLIYSRVCRPAVVNGAQESAEATRENLLCPAAHHAKEPSGRGRAGKGRSFQVIQRHTPQLK